MKTAQRSFAFGEIAPALYARPDLAMYSQALRTLRNAYVMRTGGIQSRPGTIYKGTTKSNGRARLVACIFADNQNFVLEFGNLYVRFWKEGLSIATSATAWADATVYAAGVVVSYSNVNYVCLVAHTSATATNRPSTGSSWTTYWAALSGSTYELPTPYTSAQLNDLQFAQTPGVLTIVHPSHPPAQLTRVADAQWSLKTINFATQGPAAPTNLAATISTTGIASWSSSGVSYSLNAVVVNSSVVYRCIQAHTSGAVNEPGVGASWQTYWAIKGTGGDNGGYWYVVTATDASGNESVASSPVKLDSSQTALSPTWRNVSLTWTAVSGALFYTVYRSDSTALSYRPILTGSDFTGGSDTNPLSSAYLSSESPPTPTVLFNQAGDYPSTVSFYQQRLLMAATDNGPDKVWASVTGKPFDFTEHFPIRDDDSVSWRQLSKQSIEIRHLIDIGRRLVAFTNVGEYVITGADDGVLRPGEVNPTIVSYNGANNLDPLPVDDTALYVQARGSRVLSIAPESRDGSIGQDLSILSTHLLDKFQIVSWAYQEVPHSLIWMVRSDGSLLCLTYAREAGITGWSKCDTDGLVESVCCVHEGEEDVVYLAVNRAGVRMIERMANRLADNPVCTDAASVVYVTSPLEIYNPLWQYSPTYTSFITAKMTAGSFKFVSADIGSIIQLYTNNAWVTWTIGSINSDGSAVLSAAGSISSNDAVGTYANNQWAYRPSGSTGTPSVRSATLSSAVYNALSDGKTYATMRVTSPVFIGTGARIAIKVGTEWQSWTISAVTNAMTATVWRWTDSTSAAGTYSWGNWSYQPNGLTHLANYSASVVVDNVVKSIQVTTPPSGVSIVAAGIISVENWVLRTSQYRVLWSDNNVDWTNVAWYGQMSNNLGPGLDPICGFISRPSTGDPVTIGPHRFWRYENSPQPNQFHPNVSAIYLSDVNGYWWRAARFIDANCAGWGVAGDSITNYTISFPSQPPVVTETTTVIPFDGVLPVVTQSYTTLSVGLPFTLEIETLDLDGPQQSVKNDSIRVGEVFLWLEKSGPFYLGPKATEDITQLELYTPSNDEGYALPAGELFTGVAPVTLKSTYTKNGRIFIRQPDPVPLTITAIISEGLIKGRG